MELVTSGGRPVKTLEQDQIAEIETLAGVLCKNSQLITLESLPPRPYGTCTTLTLRVTEALIGINNEGFIRWSTSFASIDRKPICLFQIKIAVRF